MQALWLVPLRMRLTVSPDANCGESHEKMVMRLIIPDIGVRVTFSDEHFQAEQLEQLVWSDKDVVSSVDLPDSFIKQVKDYLLSLSALVESLDTLQGPLEEFAKS